jgi:3'(2'), 5'-bisphosphate nucleotidase
MTSSCQSLLESAFKAVRAACRVTRNVQVDLSGIRRLTKDDRSPVTVADYAAQAVITHQLGLPNDYPLVGEEDAIALRDPANGAILRAVLKAVQPVWPEATEDALLDTIDLGNHDATSNAYWTLDPIDGTKGFLRGEHYAVSLALIRSGEVELAALGCPNMSVDLSASLDRADSRGVIFLAAKGRGASQGPADGELSEQQPIESKGGDSGAKIRICESVEAAHSRHDATARIVERLGGSGKPARIDSQCKYGVVARGQADAYLRLPTRRDYVEKIWDHAAGMLVATEAGCVVTDIYGERLDFSQGIGLANNRGIVCAASRFHSALVQAISQIPEFARTSTAS